MTSKASETGYRSVGASVPGSSCPDALPLFHLGPAALPALAALLISETLLGRPVPWLAATLTALVVTTVLWHVLHQACLGRRQAAPRDTAGWVAWGFFAWLLITTVLGVNAGYADEPLRRVLALLVTFWVVYDNLREPKELRRIMGLVMAAAVLVSLSGLIGWPVQPEADGRLRSVLDSPALLGALLCLALPLWPTSAPHHAPWPRWAPRTVGGTLCAMALVLAGSRLSILVVVLGLATVALTAWRPARWFGPVAGICLALTALAAVGLWSREGHESSASHRVFIWQSCLNLLSEPRVALLGTGLGGFADGYSMSRPWVGTDRSDTLAVVRDAHNDALQVACESGIPGAVLFLILLILAVYPLFRRGASACRALFGLRVAIAAWLLNGMANGSVDVLSVAIPAFALLGAALGAGGSAPGRVVSAVSGPRRIIAPLLACLLVLPWAAQQGAARAADLLWLRAEDLSGESRVQALAASVRLFARPESAVSLALALEGEEAIEILGVSSRKWPWNGEIRYQMCRQLARSDPALALVWAREAVRLDPYNPYYIRQRAALECAVGSAVDGLHDLRRASALFQRTLEVATARHGADSPEAEALRIEIHQTREMLTAAE